MVDIYRGDFEEPRRPRHIGWIMVLGGVIMVVIAVKVYTARMSKLAETEGRYLDKTPTTAPAGQMDPQQKGRRVAAVIWATILLLGAIFAFILAATLSHRLGTRIRAQTEKKKGKGSNVHVDPWRQAGKRLKLPDEHEDT